MDFLEAWYREHRLWYALFAVLVMAGGGAICALLTDFLLAFLRRWGCTSR